VQSRFHQSENGQILKRYAFTDLQVNQPVWLPCYHPPPQPSKYPYPHLSHL